MATKDQKQKPEWKIILNLMIFQDQIMMFRIGRKMIVHLRRLEIKDIEPVMEKFSPRIGNEERRNFGPNWPKPKGVPVDPETIVKDVFDIAEKHIDDDEITQLLKHWIRQEHMSVLSRVLEKRHAPLAEVIEGVKKYLRYYGPNYVHSMDEIIGLRVGLISRFLSDNLKYINIAKNYITIRKMAEILDRVIGPAQGNGNLGGKSAGLILSRQILIDKKKHNSLLENVYVPKSRFLTSDGLTDFLHYNALEEIVFTKYQPVEEIKQEQEFIEYIFKNSHFPPESLQAFSMILDDMEGKPIIVRSSSLLEDSFEASFSGKYKSLFLTNQGSKEDRLAALINAISEVYACTFGPDPIEYRRERGLVDFREEMGILIQQVVGTKIGKYYLPSFGGVAFSNNEIRWSNRIEREDGVVRLVAGLGTRAVDRTINDYPRLVSPGKPGLNINQSVRDQIRYSQQRIDVINLETNNFESIPFKELMIAARGHFPGIEKIVSFNRGGMLVEPVSSFADFTKEDLVITFNNLINNTGFIEQMNAIMSELSDAYDGPVDVEFASDGEKLFLLQCRPQSRGKVEMKISIPVGIDETNKIFSANQFVSNGFVNNIRYVVYVDPLEYSKLQTPSQVQEICKIVHRLNKNLPKKKFILIGPGRWGSKGDIKLGVPIMYSDINNTAMLIEVAREQHGYMPEVSFGTHFFQDLIEANIKYLPLYPDTKGVVFNEKFFNETKNSLVEFEPGYALFEDIVKLIEMNDYKPDSTLSVFMDGESNNALGFASILV